MLKKEKAIFYLIVGICAAALVILAVVGLVLQSQPTVTVSLLLRWNILVLRWNPAGFRNWLSPPPRLLPRRRAG